MKNSNMTLGDSGLYASIGNEPLIDGEGIMLSWGIAWPKVIARAWMEQGNDSPQTEWYSRLMSGYPDQVLDALVEEGFIVNAFSTPTPEKINECKTWFKKNMKIVVSESSQDVSLRMGNKTTEVLRQASMDGYDTEQTLGATNTIRANGWRNVNGLEHVLVLTLPPKPQKPNCQAVASADYVATGKIYPFTCCC